MLAGASYRIDETYIKVGQQWKYLYRALDKEGNTIAFMLSAKRDIPAVKRFFKKMKKYGVKRMVRDVFAVSGFVELDSVDEIKRVVMNKAAPLARQCAKSLQNLLKREHVSVILGET